MSQLQQSGTNQTTPDEPPWAEHAYAAADEVDTITGEFYDKISDARDYGEDPVKVLTELREGLPKRFQQILADLERAIDIARSTPT